MKKEYHEPHVAEVAIALLIDKAIREEPELEFENISIEMRIPRKLASTLIKLQKGNPAALATFLPTILVRGAIHILERCATRMAQEQSNQLN